MKNILLALALLIVGSSTGYSSECFNGTCNLRGRVANVTKEVVRVPVQVSRRAVQATTNVVRKTTSRVRSLVR